jgi:vacuolar-type H+-ATPase subunit H
MSNQTPVRDLERLVEAEARLDDLLRAAREEAGRLIAEARDRAGRAEQRWTADYQAACQVGMRDADDHPVDMGSHQAQTGGQWLCRG